MRRPSVPCIVFSCSQKECGVIGVIMVMRPSHEYMNGSSTTPPNCQNGSGVYKDNII